MRIPPTLLRMLPIRLPFVSVPQRPRPLPLSLVRPRRVNNSSISDVSKRVVDATKMSADGLLHGDAGYTDQLEV